MSQLSYPEKVKQATNAWYAKRAQRLGVSPDSFEARCINGVELDELCNSEPKPAHGDRWGDWVLNLEPSDEPSLDYVGGGYRHNPYWIRLSELQTWQGLNHWMHHLWGKRWGQETMGDFIRAVMDVCEVWKQFPGEAK